MIIFILILALGLRLINLNQSLWLDEAINVLNARDLGFWHYVSGYPIGDFHPPGWFFILWIWSHIFGFSEISVRMPSVILGVLTVYITYLIGLKLFQKKEALLGALLLATGPLHVYYSQEARMYSLSAFSAALSFYFLIKLLKREKFAGILYSLSLVFVLYSDYLTYLVIPTQLLYVFFFERKEIVNYLKFSFLGGLSIIPWAFVFPEQLINGRQTAENVPGWKKVVGGSNLKNLLLVFIKSVIGRVSIADKKLYALLVTPILGIISFLMIKNLSKHNKSVYLLLGWILIPTVLAFLVSIYTPILSYFRMVFILPAFYLLIAYGLTHLTKKLKFLFTFLLIAVNIICLSAYYLNPSFQREDWKGVRSFLQNNTNQNSLVIFEDGNLPAPYKYYQDPKIKATGGLINFPAKDLKDVRMLDFSNTDKIYLVDYLVEIADPGRVVDQNLTINGWKVVKVWNFSGVGFIYEYSK